MPASRVDGDSRRARSEPTREALMDAAEKLAADQGVDQVTIRAIVSQAKQKNESALQYHFGNRRGLIRAIHQRRTAQIEARRARLIAGLPETPTLHQLCLLMIQPSFELAREDAGFRSYVKAFGHELVFEDSLLEVMARRISRRDGTSKMLLLLKQNLTHLDEQFFRQRMESAVRLCAASMVHQSRQRGGFRGKGAELFLHDLTDSLVGLLSAEVSATSHGLLQTTSASDTGS